MKCLRFVAALCGLVGLAACAGFGVHRIDIQQGNLVTAEQVAKVKPGMSRIEVTNVLGTPLIADVFHGDRWDYYYSHDMSTKFGPFGREREKYHVTVHFKDEKVVRVDGVGAPKEILTGGGERRRLPDATLPGAPPDPKKQS
jgi:outer membrane protein assembly factor BamE